ncbi:MAG: hypothetical protein ACW98K_11290 [Candidatus Kariarchaeaceae archaeon]
MIILEDRNNIQNPDFSLLYSKFLEFKERKQVISSFEDRIWINLILNFSTEVEIFEEIIHGDYKYKTMDRHEALSKAIELDMQELLERVVLHSTCAELVQTAINHIKNQNILQLVACGRNESLSISQQKRIANLALTRITDYQVLLETIMSMYSMKQLYSIFKKIQSKSNFRKLTKFHIRIIPIFIEQFPDKEIIEEFGKKKYPSVIRELAEVRANTLYKYS